MSYEEASQTVRDWNDSPKANREPALPSALDGLARAVAVVEKNIDDLMGRIVNICDQREIPSNPEPSLSQVRAGSSQYALQLYEITDRLENLARRVSLVRSRVET